jgi:hypothetical protein
MALYDVASIICKALDAGNPGPSWNDLAALGGPRTAPTKAREPRDPLGEVAAGGEEMRLCVVCNERQREAGLALGPWIACL